MTRPSTGLGAICARLEQAYRTLGATGQGVLLAVSGGADSVAMLLASARLTGIRWAVGSIDHGLRPEASAEVEGVRALAQSLQLPFFTRAVGLAGGPGLEARARNARYEALEALRLEAGMNLIATAHTATDQAETLLMRLGRGTSLRGAAAIHPRRGNLVRPLLTFERWELEQALVCENLSFVKDPMNEDLSFLRARVRHRLLPEITGTLGEAAIGNLAQFSRLAADDEALLAGLASAAYARLSVGSGRLDAAGVRALALPLRRRVLARLSEGAGVHVDLALIDRALEALSRGGRCGLRGPLSLCAESGVLRVTRERTVGAAEQPRTLEAAGAWLEDPKSGLRVRLATVAPATEALWARVGVQGEALVLRHRERGDRLGARKLQDLFVDAKVPREDRDRVPLVCAGGGEVRWAVGLGWADSPLSAEPLYAEAEALRTQRA